MRSVVAGAVIGIGIAGGLIAGRVTGAPSDDGRCTIRLTSPAFAHRMAIPDLFTCEGEGISPPLAWSDVPKDAETLVLVMQARSGAEDVHWLIYDIPARRTGLAADTAPVDARVGMNDWGRRRYRAPCLTAGSQSYVFNLYALDRRLDLEDADWPTVQRAMAGHVLSRNVLLGSDG